MCLMQTRVHRCRHCTYTWTHPDHLDLCPEGEKLLLTHGHLCPFQELASKQGHHISHSSSERNFACDGPSYSKSQVSERPRSRSSGQGKGLDLRKTQGQQPQGGSVYGMEHGYPSYRKQQQRGEMEDMCEDCKKKHMREWADEARGRAVQVQEQMREVQDYHSQYQHLYQGGNGI